MVRLEPFFKWWTTTWITVLPKHIDMEIAAAVRWNTAWFTASPKPSVRESNLSMGWTTAWFTVPPKHQNGYDTSFWRWTTAWFTVHPKLRESGKLIQIRWTIAWITVPPKPTTDILDRVSFGKLLIELRYLRNSSSSMKRSSLVNYCLIYGTSETRIRGTFKKRGWTTAWIAVLPKPMIKAVH